MSLRTGARLGRYEILSQLGAGGMGEVYRARDARLGRDVAVKVLPSSFSSDSDRLRRFEQEARAAGVLNHPNILAIYDVGTHDGSPYVVSELLEGETLRDRLGGASSTRKSVEYAIQIAQGLAAAHEKGIVHRDLKPENLFITRDGRVKILDFGLAKLTEPRFTGSPLTDAPTVALDADTGPGVVMGTAGYMSPEQVRGQRVDYRSDMFSFGAILYEMLTGRRAFHRESAVETLNSILKEEPPEFPETSRNIAPGLERVVRHCLEKNPEERFQSARDLAFDLEALSGVSGLSAGQAAVVLQPVRWNPVALWSLASLAALIVGLAAWWAWGKSDRPSAPQPVRVNRLTDFAGLEEFPAISPDGKSVAFTADTDGRRQIWVRLFAGGAPLQLTRDSGDHQFPRWSNDSTSLIYYSPPTEAESQGIIWEISAYGGTPRRIASSLSDGDLSHDGKQIAFLRFSNGQAELVTSSRDGSNLRIVTQLVTGFIYRHVRWSPDGKWIGFQRGRVFEDDLFVVPAAGGEPRQITQDGNLLSGYAWLADSSGVVYSSARGNTILYLPTFNLWAVNLGGDGLRQLTFGEASYVYPDLNGTSLAASRIRIQFDIWKYPMDGGGEENVRRGVQITRQTGQIQTPSVGPGDQELVYLSDSGGHGNLWVRRQDGTEARQLTYERVSDVALGVPVWSPDGKYIAFVSTRNLRNWDIGLWVVSPDGSNLRNVAERGGWACWSGDSRWIYYAVTRDGVYHIEKIPAEGGQPITVRTDNAMGCAIARDGSALYYAVPLANVNGVSDFEIRFARPEDGPSELLARIPGWRISAGQTIHPLISPDGKWLALLLSDGAGANIWGLPTSGGPLRRLTNFGQRRTFIARRVSWSSDGRSIFAALGEGDADAVLLEGLLP
jgi:eukaryotic-like serine/threonine-protein kinase